MSEIDEKNTHTGLEIAVIGMAGRFPGAKNVDEFWENLKNSVESISFFSDEELWEEGLRSEVVENPDYIKARGVLENKGYFDSSFFDYLPKEAEMMDPQIRLFHECSWEALENAGYNPTSYSGLVGIYAGLTPNLKWIAANLVQNDGGLSGLEAAYLNSNFFVTLISYKLNLSGPAVAVQTACSTSLAAIHQACRALLTGECHMALAGGVTAAFPGKFGYIYQEGMILSPDGSCRAFDIKAKGTVDGEGIGIVVLKRLDAAITDGDMIHAVIKGSALNNDGNRKVGYTAPSVEGQEEVIKAAQLMAEVEPQSISYIEAHGTGTTFGDPIEIEALKRVFGTSTSGRKKYCGIGSVKTNVGHLDSAAGVAGFIKTVLALKHRLIPPSLHFETPNPKIDLEKTPFYVNVKLGEWKQDGYPLRAGVSSFGIGGTNVHAVLEEAPKRGNSSKSRDYQMIMFSAKTETVLNRITGNFVEFLKTNPDIEPADAAYTMQVGRQHFECRRMLVCSHVTEAIENLSSPASANLYSFTATGENRPVVFMFPGQGSQYVNMGLDLYRKEPVFREELQRCFLMLKPIMGFYIKDILYPDDSVSKAPKGWDGSPDINQTEITQPLIFIFEYALAKLLIKWGIEPYAMMGHSIGEYIAACLSGVFSLEDALKLVVLRGKLMQQLPEGAMLSVGLSEKDLRSILELNDELSLAAVNSTSHCVVSGPDQAIDAFNQQLQEKGYESRSLLTSHAFHSSMMEPILEEFANSVLQIPLNPPGKPYISNLTGTWITVEQATDPGYWSRHLRETVRFSDGLQELLQENKAIFMEVGPGSVLSTFVRQNSGKNTEPLVMNLVRHPRGKVPDDCYLLTRIGQLWLYGRPIDWKEFYSKEKRYRISLPTYPFESQLYWKEPGAFKKGIEILEASQAKPQKRGLDDWFYVPSWKRSVLTAHKILEMPTNGTWLVLMAGDGPGDPLIKVLQQMDQEVIVVREGTAFKQVDTHVYMVNPDKSDDFANLLGELQTLGKVPYQVVHLWSFGSGSREGLDMDQEWLEKVQNSGFYSLLHIAKAIGKHQINDEINITVVTNNMQEVTGDEMLCPIHATMLGPVRIIPREFPNISCRSIDFGISGPWARQEKRILSQLLEEWTGKSPDTIIAYRGNHRWVQTFEPIHLDEHESTGAGSRLREKGVYLFTGGLGGIGLTLAGYLAGSVKARLILTGRSDFPAREVWNQWLSSHNERDPVSLKIMKLQKIEELGGEVLVFSADTADLQQMKEVIAAAEKRYGPINGVIHSAGLPGGGLIQARSREMADRILAPKVKGTLILDHLLKDKKLDFFILCSSLNTVLPQLGQVTYCAANAFMDAFAHYKTSTDGQFTLSVNWDTWREVGMAVEAVKKLWPAKDFQTPPSEDVAHPLFDYRVVENPDRVVYVTYFRVNKHWVLEEHRIMGKATLPGTAYLEMVRAAFADHTGTECIEIQEMFFLTPLMVEDQEEKEVHTIIKKQENNFEIRFRSKVKAGEDKWVEHVRGRVVLAESRELKKQEIKIIEERCNKNEITVTEEMMKFGNDTNSLMPHFGPRWYNLKRIRFGANQVLVELELPGVFANDSRFYKLHPALMDNALGAYSDQKTHQSSEATLPFSYKRLKINAPLPQKIYSYIKSAGENQERKRILKFNITITDEEGRELVEIEEYSRLSVSQHAKTRISDDSYVLDHEPTSASHLQKNHPLEGGIFPTEGIKVFNRILGSRVPQVLVSTSDLLNRWKQNNKSDEAGIIGDLGSVEPTGRRRPRPQLNTPFSAPRNETEQTLAGIWKEFLGLEQVGIYDDFFEMGGDSLKVTTITSKIHKALEVDIPLAEFFNNSTIRGLTEYIHGSGTVGYSSIEPAEKKEYYVLSSPQTRLYLINQLDETSIAYNLPEAMLVRGKDFGKKKVEDIFRELIKRHESLRTAFVSVEGTPMQKIHEEAEFQLEYHETSAEEAKKTVENFIKPFNLGKAPLFRAGLIKIVEDQCILMIDMHHIISDGISLNIIESEFMIRNRGEELPVLNIGYLDYAEWQNSETQKKFSKRKEMYWLKQFEGEIPNLNLPMDYPRPALKSFKGNEVNFELNREETDALKKLALDEGATLFILLLALFNVLLSKICSQEDIIVGSPTGGRYHSDLQYIVGIFVNMLALRNYPSGEKTFKEFLRDVKENTLQALNNQEYQFDDLVEKIGIHRGLNRNPLFDVVLELKNWSKNLSTGDDVPGLKVTPYNFERGAANFDMYWSTSEIKGKLSFRLIYSTDLFEKTRIERFFEFFREILLSVKNNNQIKLKDIKISHALGAATANIPEADFVF